MGYILRYLKIRHLNTSIFFEANYQKMKSPDHIENYCISMSPSWLFNTR